MNPGVRYKNSYIGGAKDIQKFTVAPSIDGLGFRR